MTMLPSPIPSRLRMMTQRWMQADRWAGEVVRDGIRPAFLSPPPPINRGDSLRLCRRSAPEMMKKEIDKLFHSGAIRATTQQELTTHPGVISRMFPVPKKDGRLRPVINLKTINPYVDQIHFKMEGLKTVRNLLQPGDYMVKIDLEDAFHHVPIHPTSQKYFRFQWGETVLQWQCMPFGYRDAPRIFTKLLKVIAKEARNQGIRMVVYMDDILVMSQTEAQCRQDRDRLLKILTDFGFTISTKKCILTPSQRMEFLGVIVDSVAMTLSLSIVKMKALALRANKMRTRAQQGKRTAVRPLQKLIGHLQSVTDCVLPTRLHSNSLREALRTAEAHSTVLLSPLAIEDLQWWEENLPLWNGKSLVDPTPDFQFETDASEKGWGAVFFPSNGPRIECQGFFTQELTSNTRELTAVHNGIQSLCNVMKWKNCAVRVRTDNQVTMSYINRMGGREPHLARLAEQIHNFCLDSKIRITAEYLPGIQNATADWLSRIESDNSESKLHRTLFKLIEDQWGPHTIDCLASSTNTHLDRYISYRHDQTCMYSDLFSRPMDQKENCWMFPPASGPVIPRCLKKIRNEKINATMVIPVWPSQHWWPLVWPLCMDWPCLLPRHPATLSNWVEGKEVQSLPFWPLVAVRLSGSSYERESFRRQLLTFGSNDSKVVNMVQQIATTIGFGKTMLPGSPFDDAIHTISTSIISLATSQR